jgi:hypothetical protein
MVEVMHKVLLEATKAAFVVVSFIVVTIDEVTIIDNTQWLSIHLYVVQQWRRTPILLYMENVSMSTTSNNIFVFMLKCLLEFGGLRLEELCEKLVNIRCNGSSMFQGHRTWVTQQFKEKVAPFVTKVHYFVHNTNLVIITMLMSFLYINLSFSYKVSMPFSHTIRRNWQNFKSWWIYSKPRGINFFEM